MYNSVLHRQHPRRGALVFLSGLVAGSVACTKLPSTPAPEPEASSEPSGAAAPAQQETKPVAAPADVSSNPVESGLKLGSAMPSAEVEMKNVDGEKVTLSNVAGENGTLVVFTCNHCPYAKAWEERITEIGNAYKKKGIGVVAVNPNDPTQQAEDGFEEMKARAKKLEMEFPYVVDATSDVARDFGATKTPEVYLFDKKATLVYRGAVDDSANKPSEVEDAYLKDALAALLAGEAVDPAETKAVGCSIKFRPAA